MRHFLLTALLILTSISAIAAPLNVSVDTSALNGLNGTIDIQFNPIADPFELGTATITDLFFTGGSLGSEDAGLRSNATGDLPTGPLVISNDGVLNGVVYNATFGTSLTFLLDFAGNALTAPNQSNYTAFSIILTAGSNSLAGQVDLLGDSILSFSSSSEEFSFKQDTTSEVPEPSTFALLGAGILLIALRKRR